MDIIQGEIKLTNISSINIIMGKNGCGKSTLLKLLHDHFSSVDNEVNYVTPERGGTLKFSANIEQNIANNENWVREIKKQNQWTNFKEHSITQFRKLELLSLREIESDPEIRLDLTNNFVTVIAKINKLLTNIEIIRSEKGHFDIISKRKPVGSKIDPINISSGESELISLAIECLTFEKSCSEDQVNYLLLDEPDVHLHPDLQANLIDFLLELLKRGKFKIFLATHSTAILGSLITIPEARFGILQNGETEIEFKPINEIYQTILPIFGAHPLSNIFNQNPIMLVEGEDDVRIWQQAIRSSGGELKCYPCSVNGMPNMPIYESSVKEIIEGVYDNAIAYSLRDRDSDSTDEISDSLPIIRFKLSCRNAENLIITDEVLSALGMTWNAMIDRIEKWLKTFSDHSKYSAMVSFKESGFDRKYFDLKDVRNILIGLTETAKPWEVAIGQMIGEIASNPGKIDFTENKLCNYLGEKLTNQIINKQLVNNEGSN